MHCEGDALWFASVWRKRRAYGGLLWSVSLAPGVSAELIIKAMQDGAIVSGQWKKNILF